MSPAGSDCAWSSVPWPWAFTARSRASNIPEGRGRGCGRPPGSRSTLWAAEPRLANPTNIAIDERGRVWVLEAVNYRRHLRGQPDVRPEGDRIVILEDTNGDGTADTRKVFDQSPEIRAPLGIAVLGDRVIVSQSPNLIVYTKDATRSHRAQGGAAHGMGRRRPRPWAARGRVRPRRPLLLQCRQRRLRRHRSIGHAGAIAAPGAAGPASRPTWGAGRLLRRRRRWSVNPDGTGLQVLAQNFRNPYELAIDAFGDIWQTDNDDDGNAWTRANYVMRGRQLRVPRTDAAARGRRRRRHPFSRRSCLAWCPTCCASGRGRPAGSSSTRERCSRRGTAGICCMPRPAAACWPTIRLRRRRGLLDPHRRGGRRRRGHVVPPVGCRRRAGRLGLHRGLVRPLGGRPRHGRSAGRARTHLPPGAARSTSRESHTRRPAIGRGADGRLRLAGAVGVLPRAHRAVRRGQAALALLQAMWKGGDPVLRARALWLLGRLGPAGLRHARCRAARSRSAIPHPRASRPAALRRRHPRGRAPAAARSLASGAARDRGHAPGSRAHDAGLRRRRAEHAAAGAAARRPGRAGARSTTARTAGISRRSASRRAAAKTRCLRAPASNMPRGARPGPAALGAACAGLAARISPRSGRHQALGRSPARLQALDALAAMASPDAARAVESIIVAGRRRRRRSSSGRSRTAPSVVQPVDGARRRAPGFPPW